MGLRDQINKNPSVVTAVTAVVIVGTLIYMALQLGLFRPDPLRSSLDSPVFLWQEGDTFPVGTVRDVVEADPDDPARPVVAYRVRPTPDAEPVVWYLERLAGSAAGWPGGAMEVRRPDETTWHLQGSPEAETVRSEPPGGVSSTPFLPE